MIISSICVCFGQLLWKISVDKCLYLLIMGFALYGVGACIMIAAYRYGNVSVLQPMLSLNYVLSLILATTVLNEVITLYKCIGILLIVAGVIMIAGGEEE